MKQWFLISLFAALGLSGPASAGSGGQKVTAGDVPLDVMLIFINGTRNFAVFVEPNSIDRKTALKAATQKAGKFCRDTFGSRKIRYTKIKRRTWAVPDAWNINGSCE
ncbi:MAG TPA: hypothetical protein ENJ91_12240 [Rhodobacteraceae bacterium]|nr:hypothetical protein [Paracoccaceae bacterium]